MVSQNGMVMFNLANWYQTMWNDKNLFRNIIKPFLVGFFFSFFALCGSETWLFTWIKCDSVNSNISCKSNFVQKRIGLLDGMLLVKRKVCARIKGTISVDVKKHFGFVCIVTNSDRPTLRIMSHRNVFQFIKHVFSGVYFLFVEFILFSYYVCGKAASVQIELRIYTYCTYCMDI